MQKLKHVLLFALAVCIFTYPIIPMSDWSYFSILFLVLASVVGYVSFTIKNFWITFPITLVLVLLFTFVVNTFTSIEIPLTLIMGSALFHFLSGAIYTMRQRKNPHP